MATFMYILRPEERRRKVVCPDCHRRGEVTDGCRLCHGAGVKNIAYIQFKVQDRPIEIVKTDRDPKTGILRYWENMNEFYHETVTHNINKYIPDVPYGVHLCHDTRKSAEIECERINKHLKQQNTVENIVDRGLVSTDVLTEILFAI
jgi:hypothetical protein